MTPTTPVTHTVSYDQMLWMSDRFEGATYPPF